jgi:hypothetical protein
VVVGVVGLHHLLETAVAQAAVRLVTLHHLLAVALEPAGKEIMAALRRTTEAVAVAELAQPDKTVTPRSTVVMVA